MRRHSKMYKVFITKFVWIYYPMNQSSFPIVDSKSQAIDCQNEKWVSTTHCKSYPPIALYGTADVAKALPKIEFAQPFGCWVGGVSPKGIVFLKINL
jgi:hypothetical protein